MVRREEDSGKEGKEGGRGENMKEQRGEGGGRS